MQAVAARNLFILEFLERLRRVFPALYGNSSVYG